jgi:hypothetical protein
MNAVTTNLPAFLRKNERSADFPGKLFPGHQQGLFCASCAGEVLTAAQKARRTGRIASD